MYILHFPSNDKSISDKQLQSEKHLEQIRARFDQRQRQWNQQISTLPQKRKFSSTNLEPSHLSSRPSNTKIQRNTATAPNNNMKFLGTNVNPIVTKTSDFPNKQSQQLTNPNSNINIISVHSLKYVPETRPEVQYTQNNNQTLHNSQQTSQKNTKTASQNASIKINQIYPLATQDISKTQRISESQEISKSFATPISSIRDTAGLQFQNNSNFGKDSSQSQDLKSLPLTQSQSRYLNYLQNDLPLSQRVVSQKITQESSHGISTPGDPDMNAVKRNSQDENVQNSNQPEPIKATEGTNLLKMLDNKPLEPAAMLQVKCIQ